MSFETTEDLVGMLKGRIEKLREDIDNGEKGLQYGELQRWFVNKYSL